MSITTIYLIRHAESEPSEDLPDSDWPLSDLGKTQAKELAIKLTELSIDTIYSSPYPRARSTIQPFSDQSKIPITIHNDLRERKLCEGLVDDWLERLKKTWKDFHFAYPKGESSHHCQLRMINVLNEILKNHEGKTIALVSHGNSLALLLNSIDPTFGFTQWLEMENPDVFKLTHTDKLEFTRGWLLA